MSKLQDAIDKLGKTVDSAVTGVQKEVTDLTDKVAALQAKADAGDATPEELQAIADITAKIQALDPTVPTVLPPTP